ncbi:hypothetical protein B0H13DRAFT_2668589 [Mycena leptocephala]|nr:hypothetical protein B0H13DRAFT_2668589 [Mycena leptocephala]
MAGNLLLLLAKGGFRCYFWTLATCFVLGGILTLPWTIPWLVHYIHETVSTQKELFSRLSSATPPSGFYGQGAWWAWLITLGMSHGHSVRALLKDHRGHGWDYDLIGASSYTVAAAVDLIFKARAVSVLGEAASASPLLPAMLCAERAVLVGAGSAILSIFTALLRRSGGKRLVCIAAIPLAFSLVASAFVYHAHEAMSAKTPVIWCTMHDGKKHKNPIHSFPALDGVPAVLASLAGVFFSRSMNWEYLLIPYGLTIRSAVADVVVAYLGLEFPRARRHGERDMEYYLSISRDILLISILSVIGMLQCLAAFFLVLAALFVAFFTILWLLLRLSLFWLTYFLAFCPWMGYFPLTGISFLEMDQISAFLGVAITAALRTLQPIVVAARRSQDSGRTNGQRPPRDDSDESAVLFMDRNDLPLPKISRPSVPPKRSVFKFLLLYTSTSPSLTLPPPNLQRRPTLPSISQLIKPQAHTSLAPAKPPTADTHRCYYLRQLSLPGSKSIPPSASMPRHHHDVGYRHTFVLSHSNLAQGCSARSVDITDVGAFHPAVRLPDNCCRLRISLIAYRWAASLTHPFVFFSGVGATSSSPV